MISKDLPPLLEQLPEEFKNSDLFERAFTHKSYINESKSHWVDNERLEFLGDACLGAVVARELYRNFPEKDEGFLTKARSNLVSTRRLAEKGADLGLEKRILRGRSERESCSPRVVASCLEALMGALYLELGEKALVNFVSELFKEELVSEDILKNSHSDWKSQLQEELQKYFGQTPTYERLGEEGPDHSKTFFVRVNFLHQNLGEGHGASVKEAEQNSAQSALENLNLEELKSKLEGIENRGN